MGKLKIYNTDVTRESIVAEREAAYISLSFKNKLKALLQLNKTTIALNGGLPLKQPQGKGIIIRK